MQGMVCTLHVTRGGLLELRWRYGDFRPAQKDYRMSGAGFSVFLSIDTCVTRKSLAARKKTNLFCLNTLKRVYQRVPQQTRRHVRGTLRKCLRVCSGIMGKQLCVVPELAECDQGGPQGLDHLSLRLDHHDDTQWHYLQFRRIRSGTVKVVQGQTGRKRQVSQLSLVSLVHRPLCIIS